MAHGCGEALASLTPPSAPSADGPEGNLGSGVRLRLHPPPTSAHSACWQWAQDTDGYQAGYHTVVADNRCDSLDDPTHDPPPALAPWNDSHSNGFSGKQMSLLC
jgi:hypothetical protein